MPGRPVEPVSPLNKRAHQLIDIVNEGICLQACVEQDLIWETMSWQANRSTIKKDDE
jgi:hypothetical protein